MATVGAGVRAVLVAWGGVGNRVWRDRAPEGAQFPYVTFVDPVGASPVLVGDRVTMARRRQVQVDLWQEGGAEDLSLPESMVAALDGATVSADLRVWGCRVDAVQRLTDPTDDVVRHTVTLTLSVAAS